jgi:hypothetical protein
MGMLLNCESLAVEIYGSERKKNFRLEVQVKELCFSAKGMFDKSSDGRTIELNNCD